MQPSSPTSGLRSAFTTLTRSFTRKALPDTAAGRPAATAAMGVPPVRHIPASSLTVSKPTHWLESRFHFSFADYYNPQNMNFGSLRVVNDDLVKARNGFGYAAAPLWIVGCLAALAACHSSLDACHMALPRGPAELVWGGMQRGQPPALPCTTPKDALPTSCAEFCAGRTPTATPRFSATLSPASCRTR